MRRFHAMAVAGGATALALAGCGTDAGDSARGKVGELPATIGDLTLKAEACQRRFADDADTLEKCLASAQARQLETADIAEAVSEAYGGSRALVGDYTNEDLTQFFLGVVVEDETPGLWSQLSSKAGEERTGIHRLEYVEHVGDVECLLRATVSVQILDETGPGDYAVMECQRSGAGVTAQLWFAGSQALDEVSVETAASWTSALYEGAVS